MDEYDEAARDLGQGIRHLRNLIDAERERQEGAANDRSDQTEGREAGRERG